MPVLEALILALMVPGETTDSDRASPSDVTTDSDRAPPSEADSLQALLDAEIATYVNILTIVGRCKRQLLYESSRATFPRHPAMRLLRKRLLLALREASQSKIRQETLRTQLRNASGLQWRLQGNASFLGLAVGGCLEARDESLRMEFAASAQVLGKVAHGARMIVRQVGFLRDGMIDQGARIRRAWSAMCTATI